MNGGKSDASTSTDDVKDRPLCLFYFTHPFGVLSPEPPVVTAASAAAAAGVARAFLNMEPMEPFYWPGSGPPGAPAAPAGAATVRRASSTLSSALFASEHWFPSGGNGGDTRVEFPRRARILPPLRMPSPRDLTDTYSSDDVWPTKCHSRFSLPPIELPAPATVTPPVRTKRREVSSGADSVGSVREVKCRRKLGVEKARRRRRGGRGGRGADVRRLVGCLMRRALRGGGDGSTLRESGASLALHQALDTIREAWSEPASLRDRCGRVLSRMYARNSASEREHHIGADTEREWDASGRMTRTQLAELPPRPDASPGLLRRRYSVPETIMRKYRLAQQNSDSEECAVLECCGGAALPPCAPRSAGESPRLPPRRDRELMRKSALLRRLWARPDAAGSTAPVSADTDAPRAHRFSCDESDAFSSSLPTAKESPAGGVSLACSYEVLEVAVSESASPSPTERRLPPPPPPRPDLDVDEYVSRVLVESLHSLSGRLEALPLSVGVVQKEIKVRLQNAAVNTVVHLSPLSNHQIIFGNEELCEGGRRDECNNPRAPSPQREGNNNDDDEDASPSASPSPTPPVAAAGFDAVIQHDNVNRAVLQQIQKLFRDELRREGDLRDDDGGAVSHVEISNVDAFLSDGASGDTISVLTRDAGEWCGGVGVGAGNYFCEMSRGALVPRRCAAPRTASMEVHASSSSGAEGDALGDAASLVDSLDDPASPRPRDPARDSSAAFFVRIRDSAAPERARVAECMPDRIRQKLHRRHRTRELRAECARQSKVRQLRDELQRRRLVDAEARRPPPPAPAPADVRGRSRRPEWHRQRAEPGARSPTVERAPRRIYQKSEIREGDKCIEILEILEYSHASRSSDSTPTDEGGARGRGRRSRIPVPVTAAGDHMRLTGGHAPDTYTDLPLRALAPPARPSPPEPRERSNSLRFKRVFDMIPEERAGLGCDSAADADELAGTQPRLEPPQSPPPPLAPIPEAPGHVTTRSAGTSPPSEVRRPRISQTTMTSPPNRSAATSPWRGRGRGRGGGGAGGAASPREGIVCALLPPLHRTASLAVE